MSISIYQTIRYANNKRNKVTGHKMLMTLIIVFFGMILDTILPMFGFGAMYYKMETEKLAKRVEQKLHLKDLKEYSWSILFDSWENNESSERIYALRSELYEALGNVDLSNISLR